LKGRRKAPLPVRGILGKSEVRALDAGTQARYSFPAYRHPPQLSLAEKGSVSVS